MEEPDVKKFTWRAVFALGKKPPNKNVASQPLDPLPTSAPLTSTVSDAHEAEPASTQSQAFKKALESQLGKIPEKDKAAFKQAFQTIDERALLSAVEAHDAAHKQKSLFRRYDEGLTKTLDLLNRFMGGVAIAVQANPEISSIVVGGFRIVLDLALKFTTYFSRLTTMICEFSDYIEPLMEYADVDHKVFQETTIKVYGNMLDFGWKARRVFVDAEGAPRKRTSVRAFIHQHWDTFESEFVGIKEEMRHCLDVLLHAAQAHQLKEFRLTEQKRQNDEDGRERSAFLSWVSNKDFEKVHLDTHAKKHEDTCSWLIRDTKYQDWFDKSESSLLWCHGKAGIGKSVLASYVLEHITTQKGLQEKTGICFAYYSYQDEQLGDVSQIIAALIKQLCRRKETIPSSLLRLMRDSMSPSMAGTFERFIQLAEDFSQVFIVLDALDECPVQKRQDILDFVDEIVTEPSSCCFKVFVTSRMEMDIAEAFESGRIPIIKIQPGCVEPDIEKFVRSQINKLTAGKRGKTLYVTSEDLKEKVIHTLVSRADGMFLWVNLQLNNLCIISKAKRDREVEQALKALPRGLQDTYDRILNRIDSQDPYMRELGLNCLAWVIYARRPLNANELQTALATKPEHVERYHDIDVIQEACGYLIECEGRAMRPIHFTVQEFLRTTRTELSTNSIQRLLLDPNEMHQKLGLVCIHYIQLMVFERPIEHANALQLFLFHYEFAHYACHNFDYHITLCEQLSQKTMRRIENLLQLEGDVLAVVLQVRALQSHEIQKTYRQDFITLGFPVSAAAFIYGTQLYNLADMRQRLAAETLPRYALHLASSAGLVSAVTRLLLEGLAVNEKDEDGLTALHYASRKGRLSIVQILLQHGADVNANGGSYGNALQAASSIGHGQIVKLLLDSGARVGEQGGHYGNALQAASLIGHGQIVKLLLDRGSDVNRRGGHFGYALQAAASAGHEQTIKLLLDRGADIHAKDKNAQTALHRLSASFHRHKNELVMKMLLDQGADVNAQDEDGETPLHSASLSGCEQAIRILIDYGADVNAREKDSLTALHIASSSYVGHVHIVKLLLDHGADINAQDKNSRTALHLASFSFFKKTHIVKLLLDHGADINARDKNSRTALHLASDEGYEDTVKLLRERGATEDPE